nr:helix-turn-helix transcriptional regulator [uncultured Caproiciproducens sp.]
MLSLYEKIESLCKIRGVNITEMCKNSGASRGSLTDLKMGRKKTLTAETLAKIAEYFNVSIDYLMGNEQKETPTLTNKDERDIFKKWQANLDELENSQDGLMFDGQPLDDVTKELLAASLRKDLEMGKRIAKQKFTPKKYRKPEGD